jgi:hypothetical protein
VAKSIRIPKTPKSAYNPKRRISSLLKAHIATLEAVTERTRGVPPSKKPRTEAQASVYIAELTQYLHPPQQPAFAPAPAPVPVPVLVQSEAAARPKQKAASSRGRGRRRVRRAGMKKARLQKAGAKK